MHGNRPRAFGAIIRARLALVYNVSMSATGIAIAIVPQHAST